MVMIILAICGIVLLLWGIGMYIRMTCCQDSGAHRRSTTACADNRNSQNRANGDVADTDQDVWSVSRHINQVYGPPPNYQWPTHDQHVSLESFSLRPMHQNFMTSSPTIPTDDTGGEKIAPPPYSEVELPSYEEVVTSHVQPNIHESVPGAVVHRTQIS